MNERELTKDEMSDKERYVKGMKSAKKDFKKRYGDDAESVMYATATKMAKEGLNETEENSVSDKKENVQAEERQENLNWLEDIKRLSGLDNTYENSADAMKEYKVDESEEKTEEVIAEGQSPAQKAAFQKMLDAKKGKKSDDDVEEQVQEGDGIYHPCTKSFKHAKFGEGTVLHGEHTLSESGEVSHYDAKFVREDGSKFIVRNIPVRNMIDPVVESHGHKPKKKMEDVNEEEQVEEASGVRADTKGKVDKSEKKHYHCKLTKDDKTKGVRMVADEGESEADVKARCKRENMGWELQSMRTLDESLEENDDKKLPPEGSDAPYVDPEFAKHMADVEKKQEDVEMEGKKKDHDGDGDIDSNDYLAARDKAIKAAIAKKKGDVEEGLAELADLVALAGLEGKVELDELANEPGQGTEETSTYSVSDVVDQGNDLHAKSKQHADKAKLGDNPMATEEVDVVENKLWKAYQAELEGVKK